MNVREVRQMLVAIRGYIADPAHWVKFDQCQESEGGPRYCLVGAAIAWKEGILGAPGIYDYRAAYTNAIEVYQPLAKALGLEMSGVAWFNNMNTHETVLARLDAAIEKMRVTGEIPASVRAIFAESVAA